MLVSEERLLVVSSIIAVAGLGVLFYAISALEDRPLSYEEFLEVPGDVRVVLEGELLEARYEQNMTFFTFKTACEVPAIAFSTIPVDERRVTIVGTKTYYQGSPEVIVDDVRTS